MNFAILDENAKRIPEVPTIKKKPPFRYILKLFVYRKAYKSVDSENLNAIGAFQIFFTTHVFI